MECEQATPEPTGRFWRGTCRDDSKVMYSALKFSRDFRTLSVVFTMDILAGSWRSQNVDTKGGFDILKNVLEDKFEGVLKNLLEVAKNVNFVEEALEKKSKLGLGQGAFYKFETRIL